MAGYVLKIVMEGTHPPVWRRLLVPERITFGELHTMIQIAFDWEENHPHEFQLPSGNEFIGDSKEGWADWEEHDTLLEQFFPAYKWLRYIYDFGDDWRHKILYEKTDEEYEERYASLLKYKGDNFEEDSGGVWGNDSRLAFNEEETKARLKRYVCSRHDDLEFFDSAGMNDRKGARMGAREDAWMQEMADDFWDMFKDRMESLEKTPGPMSELGKKITSLHAFIAKNEIITNGSYLVEIVQGNRTNAELLKNLGMQEAKDYCKYLQIPVSPLWKKEDLTEKIGETFKEHPEYFLYVFYENEYNDFLEFIKNPETFKKNPLLEDVLVKALSLGLADIDVLGSGKKETARISFATDLAEFTGRLGSGTRRKTYRLISEVSKIMEMIILGYGAVELEAFYKIYKSLAKRPLEREDFYRFVYWYGRFNQLFQTVYTENVCYAAARQLDVWTVIPKMEKYAGDLDYAEISETELKEIVKEISSESYFWPMLIEKVRRLGSFAPEEMDQIIGKLVMSVMEGETLPEIMEYINAELPKKAVSLIDRSDIWLYTSAVMLETRIPIFKGRTRLEYAEEKDISLWQTGMLDDAEKAKGSVRKRRAVKEAGISGRNTRMHEFPVEIQEMMYDASAYRDEDAMRKLRKYKRENQVLSEEFIYLLADAYAHACDFEAAQKLADELKASSADGKKAAKELEERIEVGLDVMGEEDEDIFEPGMEAGPMPDLWETWLDEQAARQKPYVRESRKIGRNEPCPCGSGKKYKQCCGRNK